METIEFKDFDKIELVVGTIVKVSEFKEARKPAYKLDVDLGKKLGVKKSSAQVTSLYTMDDLKGKKVLCVINFKPKQIGPFMSEVLVTGFETENGIVLSTTDKDVPNGTKIS